MPVSATRGPHALAKTRRISTLSRCGEPLFDHLVSAREQGLQDREGERSCRLEIDGEFRVRRLVERQIGDAGTGAPEGRYSRLMADDLTVALTANGDLV
jgi:hypothetical protein